MDQFFEEEEIQKIKTMGISEEFIEGAKSCHKTEAPPASKIARWTPESECVPFPRIHPPLIKDIP